MTANQASFRFLKAVAGIGLHPGRGGAIRTIVPRGFKTRFTCSSGELCCFGAALCLSVAGCLSPASPGVARDAAAKLRRENHRLEQVVAHRDEVIAGLNDQIKNLRGVASERSADFYRPVAIEIASLSGGANYDDQPGDDGVTVHLRLRDAGGDAVKVPGRISVQLLDTSVPGSPGVVGLCVFDDPSDVGGMWHGRFGTGHFSLRCPFSSERAVKGRKLTVNVEFVDYLTGKALTTVKEVAVTPPAG